MTRTRKNDPLGTRRRIIDAAYEAFSTRGYTVTGMMDLRETAAVSGGAFSHHFATKKELGLAVIRERVRPAVTEAWILPVANAPTALAGIENAFNAIIADLEGKGSVTGCPLNNLVVELAGQDGELRSEMDAIFRSWRQELARKIREDMTESGYVGSDPDHLAAFVIAAYSGAMAMAKASQNAGPLITCWAQLQRFMKPLYGAKRTIAGTRRIRGRS
jgi:AcrR family transcriptional regulator